MRNSGPDHLNRRQLRRRKTIFSFGDLILPFVGIMAIGLLVIAGRLFFVDGFQPAASPLRNLGAALESAERLLPDGPLSGSSDSASDSPLDSPFEVVEIPFEAAQKPQEAKPETETLALAVTVTPASAPSTSAPAAGSPASPSSPSKPKAVTARSTSNATVRATNKTAAKTATKTTTTTGKWRVQVGAYGSKQAANEIVSKLAKSGYSATVFSSGKFHKVWVQAGNTKQAADSVASRLKKQGYPGSYVVPPAR